MNSKVTEMVEGKRRRTRAHIKRELVKLGLGVIKRVPGKFLILPSLEKEWMQVWGRLTALEKGYLLEKKYLLALTILHSPIHNIVRQLGTDNLKKQGLTKGMGAVARKIVSEWERQGKPRPGPMQIGETLLIMESHTGPWILRTIIGEKKKQYLITKVAKTKEIRWGNLIIPAIQPETKKKGNKIYKKYIPFSELNNVTMNTNRESDVTEEFNVHKVRAHLKREIKETGRQWPHQVSHTFLLLPGLENNWLRHITEAGEKKWQSFDADEIIELLTIPHSVIHKLAITLVTIHSVVWGKQSTVIELATALVREWQKRGCLCAKPVAIGRTLVLPEFAEGGWCLTTCCKNNGSGYMVTRQKMRTTNSHHESVGTSYDWNKGNKQDVLFVKAIRE